MSKQIYIFRQRYAKVKKPKVSAINQPLEVFITLIHWNGLLA